MGVRKMKQIRVDDTLWQEARIAALKAGITLQEWLEMAIRLGLKAAKE